MTLRASSLLRIAALTNSTRAQDARSPNLILMPAARRPMRGGFCSLRPAFSGPGLAYRHLGPLKPSRGGPVVLPEGRVTPRPRVFRHAATGLQRPPEARLRVKPHFASAEKCGAVSGELMHKALRRRSPPTPPEPIPATPSRGRRGSREYEGGRGDGDNFANIKFLRRPAAGERISRRCEVAVTA